MDDSLLHQKVVRAYLATGLVLITVFLVSLLLHGSTRDALLQEGGIVETVTVLAYLPSLVLIAFQRRLMKLAPVLILILFFFLRELDFDKRFTTLGVFKIRFFTSAHVPFIEKLIGTLILLLLASTSLVLLRRHGRAFLTGLRQHSAVAIGALLVLILLVTSKTMDALGGTLRKAGMSWSGPVAKHTGALEEIVEAGIPIVLFLALWAYQKSTHPLRLPAH
jgi:hypothetical protein